MRLSEAAGRMPDCDEEYDEAARRTCESEPYYGPETDRHVVPVGIRFGLATDSEAPTASPADESAG